MKTGQNIGCVIMASGNSVRFGGNKLETKYGKTSLFMHALYAIPKGLFSKVTVVSQYPNIINQAEEYGISTCLNSKPQDGISRTIRLGIQTMGDMDAIVFMVADQPLLTSESITNLVEMQKQNPENIIALSYNGKKGNPCSFPRKYFGELASLEGDKGGSMVISRHIGKLLHCPARNGLELADIDTVSQLIDLAGRQQDS